MINELKDLDSKVLASFIIAYRHLKINRDRAKIAMQILETRNQTGDIFDYEGYVRNEIEKLPTPAKIEDLLKVPAIAKMGFNLKK